MEQPTRCMGEWSVSVLSCLRARSIIATPRGILWQLQCSGALRKGLYVYQFIQTLLCYAGTMCNDTGVLFLCLSLPFMCLVTLLRMLIAVRRIKHTFLCQDSASFHKTACCPTPALCLSEVTWKCFFFNFHALPHDLVLTITITTSLFHTHIPFASLLLFRPTVTLCLQSSCPHILFVT